MRVFLLPELVSLLADFYDATCDADLDVLTAWTGPPTVRPSTGSA